MSFKSILRARWIKNNKGKQPQLAPQDVILGIVQGEKAFGMVENANKYVFYVPSHVNKVDIANGFEAIYGKKAIDVNTVVMPSKRGFNRLKRKSFKKAIITLAQGDKIDLV